MIHNKSLVATPWNATCLGINTFEIVEPNKDILQSIENKPGHYTVRIHPLSSNKQLLNRFGFYFCDTLVDVVLLKKNYNHFNDNHVSYIQTSDVTICKEISIGSFQFDHFHRDFNIDKPKADLRYFNWLDALSCNHNIYLFRYNNEIAGFVACDKNKLILHALAEPFRGRGLAKYFWSVICDKLFSDGYEEVISSISLSNLAVLNLYALLGARFRDALDVYHKIIKD